MLILTLILLSTRIQGDQIRIPPNIAGTQISVQQAIRIKGQLASNVEVTQDGTGIIVYPEPVFAERQRLSAAAWAVINTRCTRCHGADLIPGDVHLVGNLDMRTREAILAGGSRGPALKPSDLFGSLIYLFSSRCQLCYMTTTMGPQPLPPLRELIDDSLNTGFAYVPPDSNENSIGMPPFYQLSELELMALRDWILAGAP